jgi:hypothetical protein
MSLSRVNEINAELVEGRKNLNVCSPVMGNALLNKNRLPRIVWTNLIRSIENSLDALSNVTEIAEADDGAFDIGAIPAALIHARKNIEVCAPILEKSNEGKYKLPDSIFNKVSRVMNNSLTIISIVGEDADQAGDAFAALDDLGTRRATETLTNILTNILI